ncbi:hypothetical protein DL768_004352 [Monosporascus sp. mg162]|nr:hypothetical protein DL768_004352 [Monosporascus sp. mg162]
MSALASNITWPAGKLPIEIFIAIAEYIDRKDVQALRLVNRECYRCLSGYYLRQLVVHVGPNLCATLDSGLPQQIDSAAVDVTNRLVDTSYVFSSFGDQIRRFALALELSEPELATPKVYSDLALYVRPWGVYRWPVEAPLSTQSTLQRITESLERSKGMFRILSHLGNVRELALSCEGGLGYLQGPDVTTPPHRPVIFGDKNGGHISEGSYMLDFDTPYSHEALASLVSNTTVPAASIPGLVNELLKREGISLEKLAGEERRRCPLPDSRPRSIRPSIPLLDCCKERAKTLRLQPDMLTRNQKIFLSQHIAAQQALIQSYLLGVLDNASSFDNLTNVKIASLPSLHVDLLCRDDFWSKLTRLEEVFLAVVPDWRTVTQYGSHVEDAQVYPTDAIPKVFRLLANHIGKQERIKRLHFEWLCGGELASGSQQRNKHVLPAPFLKSHRKIVDSRPENLLILPHVTHLSLKNCWFTPHVFYRIVREMALKSLVSLELVTVSLSGPPIEPSNRGNQNGTNGTPNNVQTPAPPMDPTAIRRRLRTAPQPCKLSWGHIIDMLTPGGTIREYLHEKDRDEDTKPLRLKKELKLEKLSFKSCGYVEVPDGRLIAHWPFPGYTKDEIEPPIITRSAIHSGCPCVEFFMQVSTDPHLARVIQGMPEGEEEILSRVFGFRFGWEGIYDDPTIDAARNDGFRRQGRGRFSGTIERHVQPSPLERYAGVFYPDEPNDDRMPVEVFDTSLFDRDYDDEVSLSTLIDRIEARIGYVNPSRAGPHPAAANNNDDDDDEVFDRLRRSMLI